jgi:hypothetical protein
MPDLSLKQSLLVDESNGHYKEEGALCLFRAQRSQPINPVTYLEGE